MIVCTECGHRNDDDDDFCGNCGSFLEFSGQPVVTTGKPDVVEKVDGELEEDDRPTIVERVKAAVRLGDGEPIDEVGDDGVPDAGVGGATVPGEGGHTAPSSVEEKAAAEARRTQQESQRRAQEAQRAAEDATRAAQEAEAAAEAEARHAAEAEARQEAEHGAKLRAERGAADAQEQARAATVAVEEAMAQQAADEGRQTVRAGSEEAEHSKREAAERAARNAADLEARQRAEAEAREAAERAAREEATTARRQAEAQAKAAAAARGEAEARRREAQQAVRMAALVAKARPTEEAAHPATSESTSAPSDTSLASNSRDRLAATDSRTGARRPEPVQPQRPKPKRPKPTTAPDEVLNPGDLICGQCGVGNDPVRRFCRRCGNSLVAAVVVPKPPWWKRIFERKPKAKAEAGSRPHTSGATPRDLKSKGQYALLKTKSTMGKLGRVAALLALVGIAGLSLGPWRDKVGDQIGKVRRLVSPEYDIVRPSSPPQATSALDGHPAAAAIDQISNSYWAEGAEGPGEGQGLTFAFDEPVDIDRVGFLNGASEQPQDFVTQPRLREVQLVFDDGTTEMITLNDDPKFQHYGIRARGITKMQLQIISVYPSLEGQAASLAEVEFRTKR